MGFFMILIDCFLGVRENGVVLNMKFFYEFR